MAFGYRYTLQRQHNGGWPVRFPRIPEALTEGETKEEAHDAGFHDVQVEPLTDEISMLVGFKAEMATRV